MSLSSAKRARKVLNIKEKVDIIKELEKNVSVKFLSQKHGVGESTIYDLKKNKEKIKKFFMESESVVKMESRKTLRQAENPKLDETLYEWFRQRRNEGVPISGPILIEKARMFHQQMGIESQCNYSQGWLQKFKNRHGIRELLSSGEKLSADNEAAVLFVDELTCLIEAEGLTEDQIYNADETGIFWKALPKRTLVLGNESSISGRKESKERITALVCSNAAGNHKCTLLVIGKSAHPRALKNVKSLPLLYKANKRAWITQVLFLDWYNNNFIPEARKHCVDIGLPHDCKILLLLDNCPAHPDEELCKRQNVFVKYLPPNCTSLIQPMDQGVIKSLKFHYRKEMMRAVLNFYETNKDGDFCKAFNIKDAIFSLSRAWHQVSASVLKNTWHNLLIPENEDGRDNDAEVLIAATNEVVGNDIVTYANEIEQNHPSALDLNQVSQWINCDSDAPAYSILTDAEIVQMFLNSQENSEEEDSEEEVEIVADSHKMNITEAISTVGKLINFAESKTFISQQEVMQLYRLQDKLVKEKPKMVKQATLLKYYPN